MRISYNWLKEFVQLPASITAREVAEKLKMSTVEVEDIIEMGAQLANVVVGKIVTAEKHPNADKLKVCAVDLGGATVQIVCGGSNVVAGMQVAVAKVGAKVKWHGEGDLVELAPAKIRGEESFGMICGADEIGLADRFPKKEEKEIVDLTSLKFKTGTPLAEALKLNDVILEIDNKSLSNRPDLWGHYGIAREVAALTGREALPYKTKKIAKGKGVNLKVRVENKIACPKYMAVAMSGVTVCESPAWLKEKLAAVGVRSINNVVDATNYVMFDIGQPLHAFDRGIISDEIVVRGAKAGERIVTLDEKERVLSEDMLVIANPSHALAIAGVMGGLDSGISRETQEIIIEAANFEASCIRQTSTRLGLRSDSSARFEKSLDHNLCAMALERMVALVLELCPKAKVASAVADVGKPSQHVGPLNIPVDFFSKKIGVVIPTKIIVNILSRLGFGVKEKKNIFSITIPTWRATKDISIPEDILEEVARIYGYENIPASLPIFPITPPTEDKKQNLEKSILDIFVRELRYTEVYNYSFVSGEQIKKFGDDAAAYLELDNPLSKERPYLRQHLLFNIIDNIQKNSPEYSELRLVEIGKKFMPEETGVRAGTNSNELLPRQDTWLCAAYADKENATPFWKVKQAVEIINSELGLSIKFVKEDKLFPWDHPTRVVALECADKIIGAVFELNPQVGNILGLDRRVAAVTLNLTALSQLKIAGARYVAMSLYPEVVRDLAFTVKKNITHAEIVAAIGSQVPLFKKVELFDVFAGKGVATDKKSVAYHLTYGNDERTLTALEVDVAEARIIKILQDKCGAEMRK